MSLSTSEWHQRFRQQCLWTREVRRYLFQKLDLTEAKRLVEVGSGTGAVLQEIEQGTSYHGQVFGVDLDEEFLNFAAGQLTHTHLTAGDGYRLPFPSRTFDFVICHFLLLWVDDAARVVREMQRITRSGGWVVALAEPDYGGRIDFPLELGALGDFQEDGLKAQGADTRIGRRLREIWTAAGLAEVECGLVGGQWKGAPDEAEIDLEWKVLRQDLNNQIDPGELDRLEKLDREAWRTGSRLLFVPTFYACGRKS